MTGAVLAIASAPAAAAAMDFKPHPHHHHASAAGAAKTAGRGHKPPHHRPAAGSKHGNGKPGAVQIKPRTAPAPARKVPAATSPGVRRATPVWVEPATPKPARPATAHRAKPKAAPAHHSTWQRDDSTQHADLGVVRAFASDLKRAGQSAGFP
ncbi:MAG: hypothetical protein JO079_12080, partial [Frankiaceae bacterium]|nr:hypothetical protein [Frankiaceae bacterium]MBV9368624.1 hypothetical protein [Frankiales bacterium]